MGQEPYFWLGAPPSAEPALLASLPEPEDGLRPSGDDPARIERLDAEVERWISAYRLAANQALENGAAAALLRCLLKDILIGGNHLALLIGHDHPPHTATDDEANEHYCCILRQPDLYDIWLCWRSIMRARDILNTGREQ